MAADEAGKTSRMGGGAEGRVALVTGGTGGIGRAVALGLARGGDRVLFVGRGKERGAAVLAKLREARPRAAHAFLHADLSLLSETARVAEEVAHHTEFLGVCLPRSSAKGHLGARWACRWSGASSARARPWSEAPGLVYASRVHEKANPPRGGGAKPTGLHLTGGGGRAAEGEA